MQRQEHVLPLMVELVIINEPPESFNIPPPSACKGPAGKTGLTRGIVTNRTIRDGHGAIFVQHTSSSSRTSPLYIVTNRTTRDGHGAIVIHHTSSPDIASEII